MMTSRDSVNGGNRKGALPKAGKNMKLGLIGIPFNGDGTRPEIENPAAVLREAGMSTLALSGEDSLVETLIFPNLKESGTGKQGF